MLHDMLFYNAHGITRYHINVHTFFEFSVDIIQLAARCGEAEFNQYVRCSPAQMLAIYIYMKRNAKFHMF